MLPVHSDIFGVPIQKLFAKLLVDDMDKTLLLTIQAVCNSEGVTIPWDRVGSALGQHISGGAIVQHLSKLRIRMVAANIPVPPPLRRGGTIRLSGGSQASPSTPKDILKTTTPKSSGKKRVKVSNIDDSEPSDQPDHEYDNDDPDGEYGQPRSKRARTAKKGKRTAQQSHGNGMEDEDEEGDDDDSDMDLQDEGATAANDDYIIKREDSDDAEIDEDDPFLGGSAPFSKLEIEEEETAEVRAGAYLVNGMEMVEGDEDASSEGDDHSDDASASENSAPDPGSKIVTLRLRASALSKLSPEDKSLHDCLPNLMESGQQGQRRLINKQQQTLFGNSLGRPNRRIMPRTSHRNIGGVNMGSMVIGQERQDLRRNAPAARLNTHSTLYQPQPFPFIGHTHNDFGMQTNTTNLPTMTGDHVNQSGSAMLDLDHRAYNPTEFQPGRFNQQGIPSGMFDNFGLNPAHPNFQLTNQAGFPYNQVHHAPFMHGQSDQTHFVGGNLNMTAPQQSGVPGHHGISSMPDANLASSLHYNQGDFLLNRSEGFEGGFMPRNDGHGTFGLNTFQESSAQQALPKASQLQTGENESKNENIAGPASNPISNDKNVMSPTSSSELAPQAVAQPIAGDVHQEYPAQRSFVGSLELPGLSDEFDDMFDFGAAGPDESDHDL